ncbi:MAG: hypothetical protein ACK4IC_08815 [Erythrobacter sp.]
MIPFLPELPAAPLSAVPLPKALAGGAAGADGERPARDFAGLLDAALPGGAQAVPEAGVEGGTAAAETLEPVPVMRPLGLLATATKAGGEALPSAPMAVLPAPPVPTGTSLPEHGTDVPPAAAPAPALPQPIEPPVAASAFDRACAPLPAGSADSVEDTPALPEAALPEAAPPEAALLALLPAASPVPVAAPAPARAGGAANPARAVPVAAFAAAPAKPAARQPALPLAPAEEDTSANISPAAAGGDQSGASPQPAASAPATPAPQPAVPALAQPAPPAAPLQGPERAETRPPAPQQETTIAQLGELREALRSARPELTLRHAEFGPVSLRIEGAAAAPQDWRAVLASRDPGFVPAIQAALAERAIVASADSAATGGQNGPGSDRQYGFSPGAGQGSSQPYFGQSGGRDEGANSNPQSQQQRRAAPGRATADGAPESETPGQIPRGLFA